MTAVANSTFNIPSTPARRKSQPSLMVRRVKVQAAAIAAIVSGLRTHERGVADIACRVGKTYIGIGVATGLNARRVLVLVPNLGLAAQMLGDWRRGHAGPLRVLVVCSDESVSHNDSPVHDASEIDAEVTTNAAPTR